MHVFDYRFLRSDPLDHGIVERAINIESMRARCEPSPCTDVNEALRRKAMIMSVADSNAIEGIRTSEGRLMGILTDSLEPQGHDECEIAGYRDALRYIHENHRTWGPARI